MRSGQQDYAILHRRCIYQCCDLPKNYCVCDGISLHVESAGEELSPPYEACFPHDIANDGIDTAAIIGFASGALLMLLLVTGGLIIVLVNWRRRRARSVFIGSLIL